MRRLLIAVFAAPALILAVASAFSRGRSNLKSEPI
jgi:hypothetical protein